MKKSLLWGLALAAVMAAMWAVVTPAPELSPLELKIDRSAPQAKIDQVHGLANYWEARGRKVIIRWSDD